VPHVYLRPPAQEPETPVSQPAAAAMPAGLPGAAGRYQLVGEIGRGGMGAVLKARDPDLGRDVALKVLLETHRDQPELARRFLEEAQIAGQLQHPGVTPVYELGVLADQRPFFAMKLVKGHTLAALLRARQSPAEDLPRYLTIFGQVCQTLAYAHARGVIHRDLKPSNVMVGAFGEVQVMDWGLAKVLPQGGVADEQPAQRGHQPAEDVTAIRTQRSGGSGTPPEAGSDTQAGTMLGTPAYMAPEQALGEIDLVDERADVFGVGALLCEILTGQPPFTGAGAEAQRKARTGQLAEAYARLEGCGVDAELVGLARRCLAFEPWERPRHAGQVAEAVTAYQDAVAERLRQAELAGAEARAKAAEERKRRRLTVALAASVLLAVTAGGGAWLWLKAERDARQEQADRDIRQALDEAKDLRRRAGTPGPDAARLAAEARPQVQRALALAASGDCDPGLADQVRQLAATLEEEDKDRRLLAALEQARLAQAEADMERSDFRWERAVPLYREALRAYGMPAGVGHPEAVAARIRQRPAVREALAAALDEWAMLAQDPGSNIHEPHLAWLLAVAAAADPGALGNEARRAAAEDDPAKRRAALEQLAAQADVERLPALALTLLAARLWKVQAASCALKLLRRAQAQHPGDFWLNYHLGMALRNLQPPEADEAVRYLTAAVALRPDSAGTRLSLGVALAEKQDLDGAMAAFRRAIALDPRFAKAHTNLGNVLQDKGDLAEAIAEHRRAIALDPKLAQAHSNLGAALNAQGDRDGAIASYRRAIGINPRYAKAHFNLGTALKDRGDLRGAIAAWRQAIELDPRNAKAHTNLGTALHNKGDVDGAIRCYRTAIACDPKLAEAHYNLGLALQAKGDLGRAIAHYRRATALDPKHALAHTSLGVALDAQGNRDEAIAHYRRAIRINPRYAKAHYNLGNALYAKGDLDGAIRAYRRAITLDPKHAKAHTNLGLALHDKEDLAGAIAALRKAIALDPRDAAAHTNLGVALDAKGDLDGAIAEHRRAIALKPDFAGAHCNLGFALTAQGRLAEALASFRRGHELGIKQPAWRYPSAQWVRRAERLVVLEGKLPAFVDGKYKPKDNAERLGLAWVCQLKKRYHAAARLYAHVFAADPKRADDLKAGHRYNAACYAALAAAGRGQDAAQLDAKERAHWRQQAVAWLRADLTSWARELKGTKPSDCLAVAAKMRHWQRDADLVGIRDKDAVAKLPAEEQKACQQLWADVAALRKKAADGK
jgi:serine/threonine-protein kinase